MDAVDTLLGETGELVLHCVCTLHHAMREEALDVVDTLLGETGELVLHCVCTLHHALSGKVVDVVDTLLGDTGELMLQGMYFASCHEGRGLGCCRHLAGRDR